jgi:hypothetical protein
MKRKILFLSFIMMTLMLQFFKSNGQVQTDSFTTTSYQTANTLPIGYNSNFSYCQSIYMPYLFSVTNGSITKISYYWQGTNLDLTNSGSWTIYMGHTPDSIFATLGSWRPLGSLTQVFSGNIQVTASGWMDIVLTTPFPYNASLGNLVIAVDENAPGAASPGIITNTGFRSGSRWSGIIPNFKSIYRNSTTNIDPSAPDPTGNSRIAYINHLKLDIIPSAVLPVTLKEFRAVNAGSHNLLYWASATESTGDTYILERSRDGKTFTEISHFDAKVSTDKTYNFTDETPFAGITFYRLRLTGKDGKINFSTVVNATVKQGGFQVKLYPNPVKNQVTLAAAGFSGKPVIQICELSGHAFKTIAADETGITTINIDFLPTGTYFMKYKDETHLEILKFIKE